MPAGDGDAQRRYQDPDRVLGVFKGLDHPLTVLRTVSRPNTHDLEPQICQEPFGGPLSDRPVRKHNQLSLAGSTDLVGHPGQTP